MSEIELNFIQSVENTFTKMCYSTPILEYDVQKYIQFNLSLGEVYYKYHILFDGEITGNIDLLFPSHGANDLFANYLGIEKYELDGSKVNEYHREIINIICGDFLSRNFPSYCSNFNISTEEEFVKIDPVYLGYFNAYCILSIESGYLHIKCSLSVKEK